MPMSCFVYAIWQINAPLVNIQKQQGRAGRFSPPTPVRFFLKESGKPSQNCEPKSYARKLSGCSYCIPKALATPS